MPKFLDRITAQEFSSAASAAIDAAVDGDTNARIQIDAGGKVTWGSGDATGDVNLYRDAADVLRTDDTLRADEGLAGPVKIPVKNTSASTIAKGIPVYATGSVGASGAVEVSPSAAGTSATMPALGLTESSLAVNGEGYALVLGVVNDVDTSSYTINASLYVASSGGLTTTRPTASSDLVQKIGRVVRVHASTGQILVLGAGRTNDVPNAITITNGIVGGSLSVGTEFTLPTADGTVDQVISTDGAGTLSWVAQSGGAGVAGSDGYIQYNNSGSFGGEAELFWDDVNNRLGVGTATPSSDIQLVAGTTSNTPLLTITHNNDSGNRDALTLDNNYDRDIGIAFQNQGVTKWRLLNDSPTASTGDDFLIEDKDGNTVILVEQGGNVGIGTTTPNAKFGVSSGSLGTADGDQLENARFFSTVSNASYLRIFTERDGAGTDWGTAFTRIQQRTDATDQGYIQFNGADNQSGISIGNTNTEYMRIKYGGNVGIGTTSPDNQLHVYNSSTYGRIKVEGSSTGYTQADILLACSGEHRGAGVYMFNSYHDKTWYAGMPYTSTDRYILGRRSSAAMQQSAASVGYALFQFYSNGAAYNTTGTWGSTSDIRMKGEVETARSYLTDLNQLRVVNYRLTKDQHIDEDTGLEFRDREEPSEKMLGLIAQEVEEIFPALVTDGTDEAMVLKQSVLVPMLLTAVQELSARIEALEAT